MFLNYIPGIIEEDGGIDDEIKRKKTKYSPN